MRAKIGGPVVVLTFVAGLWASPARANNHQIVVVDETYTATSANTSDSHYVLPARAGTPSNWRSPINYADGTVYVRLDVLSKPSAAATDNTICFVGAGAACFGSRLYTAPGLVLYDAPLQSLWHYTELDWSQPVAQLAFVLKDASALKVQGDPLFYPTTIHVTMTVVPPGETYAPPTDVPPSDGGAADAATSADAGVALVDAGRLVDAGKVGDPEGQAPRADAGMDDRGAATTSPTPRWTPGDTGGGCSVAGSHGASSMGLLWGVGLLLRRARRRRRAV